MNPLRDFGFLLRDVSRLAARNFERHASEVKLGLNLVQCKVLIYLQRHQGITQVRLADLTDTEPMTLVRILDRMEQDGWIERRPDPMDRRVRRLYLKPAARPVVRRILALADRARAASLAGLDAAERNTLVALLTRMHVNLSGLVPGNLEPARGDSDVAQPAPGDSLSARPERPRTRPGTRGRNLKAAP